MGHFYYKSALEPKLQELSPYVEPERLEEFQRRLYEHRFSMMDMDQNAIIPFFGYKGTHGLNEYYRNTQAAGRLHLIKVPTLFLNAEDDPCYNPELYPYKEFEGASDHIVLAMTKRGGHCCHLSGGLWPTQW